MRIPKETAGQHFEGLQMLTSLLAPKGSRSAQPLVEEIGMLKCIYNLLRLSMHLVYCLLLLFLTSLLPDLKGACGTSEACQEDKDEEEDFDWQLEQQPYIESSEEDLKKLQKYGFGNLRTGVFFRLQVLRINRKDIKNV